MTQLEQYFNSTWRPLALSVCLGILRSIEVICFNIPLVNDFLYAVWGYSLVMILAVATYQFYHKMWRKGLVNIFCFVVACFLAVLILVEKGTHVLAH